MTHIADNHDALLDYVYDEGHPAERLKIARHLQNCATCSVAVLELQEVRGLLSDWTPPFSQLGFKIVQESNPEPHRAWWRPSGGVPVWAQAAAAVLIFAAGLGVSQLNVSYSDGVWTVSTPWSVPPQDGPLVSKGPVMMLPTDVVLRASAPDPRLAESRPDRSQPADELERRVRALIAESEARQERRLGSTVVQMARELDSQRIADMRRVEQNIGQLESQTGAEIQQQRQLMDYLVRTSGTAK
jgi:hypothetical protein